MSTITTPTPKVVSPTKVVVSGAPPTAWQAKKAFASSMSGYSDASPIWRKPLPEVLDLVMDQLAHSDLKGAEGLINELRKRVAYGKLMAAQK